MYVNKFDDLNWILQSKDKNEYLFERFWKDTDVLIVLCSDEFGSLSEGIFCHINIDIY